MLYDANQRVADWDDLLAHGRNAYGNPDQVVRAVENTMRNFDFDVFSATFNFGGLPHEEVKRSMRLFANEVLPVFKNR